MPKESIVDASIPSAGRIYDYLLGGHHNFQVDRMAAEQLVALAPFFRKTMRLQRWCLQDIAHELTVGRGYDVIIDFASGLPTQDHIHAVVPQGTTVIYSDYDPVVVEYAREILGDTPNVYFFEADARRPEELLYRPEVVRLLNGRRDVALVYWGIPIFLADQDLAHAARTLYEWADDEDGCLVFNAQGADGNKNEPGIVEMLKMYQSMGSPLHIRSLTEYVKLIAPWLPDENGFVSLLQWHGLDNSELNQVDTSQFGPTGAGYGAYLQKPR